MLQDSGTVVVLNVIGIEHVVADPISWWRGVNTCSESMEGLLYACFQCRRYYYKSGVT